MHCRRLKNRWRRVRERSSQLATESESAREHTASLESAPEELKAAIEAQQTLLQTVQKSQQQQDTLRQLGVHVAAGSVTVRQIEQAVADLEAWRARAGSLVMTAPRLSEWPAAAGPDDLLASTRRTVEEIAQTFGFGLKKLEEAVAELGNALRGLAAFCCKIAGTNRTIADPPSSQTAGPSAQLRSNRWPPPGQSSSGHRSPGRARRKSWTVWPRVWLPRSR